MTLIRALPALLIGATIVVSGAKIFGATQLHWAWVLTPIWAPMLGYFAFAVACIGSCAVAMGSSRPVPRRTA